MELRKRLITAVTALTLVTVGTVGGIAVPAGLSIRALIDEIRVKQREIDGRFVAQRQIRGSMANFGAIIDKVVSLSSVAVREERELDLVTAIEDAASANGVEHTLALETAGQKDLSPWEKEVPLRIDATGDYPDVLRFLNAVERLPYLVSLDTVRVAAPRSGTGASAGRVSLSASGIIYWQSAKAPEYVTGAEPAKK